MSLGISAAGWGAIAGGAASLYSASKAGKGGSQTTQQQVDPRLGQYLYGEDDKGGLLKDVDLWYQANKSGMNDQMAQGLNTLYGVYTDPSTMAGYQQMANLGSGLMSTPVVGNPFSDGRAALGGGASNLGMGGQQPQFQSYKPPTSSPVNARMDGPYSSNLLSYQQPAAAPAPAPAEQSSGWEALFDGSKRPVLSSDKNKSPFEMTTNWVWNGGMWTPERLEQGGP
nr:hypothetical protein [Variovorax boronicumulans]